MVNTFIISDNTLITMKILDTRRLIKQRVEAMQIINVLQDIEDNVDISRKGWKNHPAVKSWIGYIDALKHYCNCAIKECINRKVNNKMKLYELNEDDITYPPWYFNKKIQYSHMARLLHKQYDYYNNKVNPPEEYLKYGYIWPSKFSEEQLNLLTIHELGEPFIQIIICKGIKKNGIKCINKALNKNEFCGIHKGKKIIS